MPGANESSTVEGHRSHWMPIERRRPLESKNPVTPTTACSLSSARVTAGSSRSTARRPRAQAGPDAAVRGAGDRPMELQAVAPELLVAEGVEAEDLAALVDEPRHLRLHRLVAAGRLRLLLGR